MHEDLQSIVAADLAARRELEDVKQRLAARHETERARLLAAREAARAARASCRARRRALTESAAASAMALRALCCPTSSDRRNRTGRSAA